MKPARRLLCVVGAWLLVMAAGGPVTRAQGGYPEPVDLYVNDFARLLTPEHAAAIRSLFSDLKRDSGIEAVAVTIGSIGDYPTGDATIESFATHLFNTWGVGDRAKNNGVLILVAVNDRQVRIEVGSGYGTGLNAAMQEVIDEHMLPAFRRDEYSRGIYDGARAVVHELTGQWPDALAPPSSASGDALQWGSIALVASGMLVGGVAIVGAIRYRRYYRRCPQCQRHALGTVSQTDVAPTHTSTGRKRVIKECRHCHYHDESFLVLPLLVESSGGSDSGSGGDFGGGSSSGDGASGSW